MGFEVVPIAATPRAPLMVFAGTNSIPVGTNYLSTLSDSTVEADNEFIIPFACTVRRLRIRGTQGATGTMAITVRLNGVATALLIVATAGTGAVVTLSDLVNSFAAAAGDRLTFEVVVATAAYTVKTCSVELEPT